MDDATTVAHGPEHTLERLIFFSDAVFAIAVTLLVIDIHAPRLPYGSPDAVYWAALAHRGSEFVGFIISFFVIGSFWGGHHRMMARASHYAPSIALPNLMLLFAIVALPFFTAFVSANPLMRVPVFCYCGWLLVAALLNRRLQTLVLRPPVVDERTSAADIAGARARSSAVILGATTATLVGLVVPALGQVALVTIPVWRWLLVRRAAVSAAARAG